MNWLIRSISFWALVLLLAPAPGAQAPRGSIVGWHKDLPGAPPLPPGWVECNGQVLNDPSSIYHGQELPDLNGERRFLRGSPDYVNNPSPTGTLEEDQLRDHWHDLASDAEHFKSTTSSPERLGAGGTPVADDKPATASVTDPISDGIHGTPRTADETRPINMSVVWVMKVKSSPVPVGSILGWHKDLQNVPPLPDGWVECNGQVVSDPQSPFDGVTLPDLNGEARFLRGGATSGILEDDAFQGHRHEIEHELEYVEAVGPITTGTEKTVNDQPATLTVGVAIYPWPAFKYPIPTANETRPTNSSVVWILKTKKAATPAGAVLGWHRDFPNTPALNPSWYECSGEWIRDPGTLFHLVSVPTFNYSRGFLRGGDTSGVYQSHAFQGHAHGLVHNAERIDATPAGPLGRVGLVGIVTDVHSKADVKAIITDGVNGIPRVGYETRPINMAVSWIIYLPRILAPPTAGLIVAWHGSFPNTPALPAGWAEMDGTVLDDPESPFDGLPLEDLNGEGRFLKGHYLVSGILEDDAMQGHGHSVSSNAETIVPSSSFGTGGTPLADDTAGSLSILDPISDGVSGAPRPGPETRPVNMSVIWTLQTRPKTALPIGSIVAWDKDRENVGPLQDGWLECNGQVVSDPSSPYDGLTLPDLNLSAGGRFLRGSSVSGTLQEDTFQGHRHDVFHNTEYVTTASTVLTNGVTNSWEPLAATITVEDPISAGYGFVSTADETRPYNLSAVWVIKTRDAQLPVGSIVAWHRSILPTPVVPPDWYPCNGTWIDDGNSPFYQQYAPYTNYGYFIRGGESSQIYQIHALQGHHHAISHEAQYVSAGGPYGGNGGGNAVDQPSTISVLLPIADTMNGTPRIGFQTRPINMTVVWLIYLPSRSLKAPAGTITPP